jgi:hypothetical protein
MSTEHWDLVHRLWVIRQLALLGFMTYLALVVGWVSFRLLLGYGLAGLQWRRCLALTLVVLTLTITAFGAYQIVEPDCARALEEGMDVGLYFVLCS